MSESEVSVPQENLEAVPQLSKEELEVLLLNAVAHPPRVVFDPEQYERDLSAGLIELTRANPGVANKSPYSPSDIKAAHGAATINILPVAGKKNVTIAITIAYNWPADYVQSCFDAMCRVYGLTSKPIEMIYLNSSGAKASAAEEAAALLDINTNVINPIKTSISNSASATNSSSILGSSVSWYNGASTGVVAEHQDKAGWLGELLLDLWAYAMNPNAKIRVICAYNSTMLNMINAVKYASNDSNFAVNDGCDFVNMSWGGPAGIDYPSYDAETFSNPKICYLGATGDYRYSTYPSTSHNVLAVGGTSLYYDATQTGVPKGPYNSVWVGANAVAPATGGVGAGAGFAIDYARPAYQNNLAALSTYNTNPKRCTPDVSSIADSATGVLIFFTDGTSTTSSKLLKQQTGGTSLASPILCGLFSHVAQKNFNENLPALTTKVDSIGTSTNLQSYLYSKHAIAANAGMFYDVVDGTLNLPTNAALGISNSAASFSASAGYDIASGLGVPMIDGIMNVMFPAQVAQGGGGTTTITQNTIPNLNSIRFTFNINV